jgi:hypothetical protein
MRWKTIAIIYFWEVCYGTGLVMLFLTALQSSGCVLLANMQYAYIFIKGQLLKEANASSLPLAKGEPDAVTLASSFCLLLFTYFVCSLN